MGTNFVNIPTTGTASPLTATIPANTPAGAGYRVRVVSSNPVVEGTPSAAFAVSAPATAVLSGGGTVPPGGSANLSVQLTGKAPWTVTLSDNSTFTSSVSPLVISKSPAQTTTYTLLSVTDACGGGTVQGSATITINTVSIATTNLDSAIVCAGAAVPVSFTSTGTFGGGNTFTVQLSNSAGTNFVDIPTTGTASPLTATIPANTPAGAGYRVRVVSSNPVVEGTPSAAFAVSAPATAVLSGGGTVPPGGSANLSVQLTGKAPWTVTLSDNSTFTSSVSPLVISKSPAQTTTYTLLSVTDACGGGTVQGSATITINTVSIATTNLDSAIVCAGAAVPVSFTSTGTFGGGNTFTVQLSNSAGTNFVNIPTTGTASPLTATIPANTPAGAGYRVRVVSSNPVVEGTPSAAFAVSAPATAVLSGGGTVPPGGSANLSVQLTGKAPWTVTLSDNSTYTSSVSPLVISKSPAQTTTYTLLSVTDACGGGTVQGSATITVQAQPPVCKPICAPVTFVIIRRP